MIDDCVWSVRKMKVRAESLEGAAPAVKAAPVGSAQWRDQKAAEAGEGGYALDPAMASVTVAAKLSTFNWKILPSDQVDGGDSSNNLLARRWLRAVISSNKSILASCGSCSSAVVMGVAYSTTVVSGEDPLVFCDGITLFPEGPAWITRALLCVGKTLDANKSAVIAAMERPDAMVKAPKGRDLRDSVRYQRCVEIESIISQIKSNHIQPNHGLMTLVDSLFDDFLV